MRPGIRQQTVDKEVAFSYPITRTSIALILCCAIAKGVEAAPVEGDSRLFEVVLAAQKANIARFPRGEIKACWRHYFDEMAVPSTELHIRQRWDGDAAYWEFERYDPVDAERIQREKGIQLSPRFARMVTDGKRFHLYYPGESVPTGALQVFWATEFGERVRFAHVLDLRPSAFWFKCDGKRPWEQLIAPHPLFPGKARTKKWVVRQEADKVFIERHDTASSKRPELSPDGVAYYVASMTFAGNLIETSYKSKAESISRQLTWNRDPEGRVTLKAIRSSRRTARGQQTEELDILSCEVISGFPPVQFTPKALKLKWGAEVEDEIAKKKYTYRDDAVTQEGLNKLSKALKTKAEAK